MKLTQDRVQGQILLLTMLTFKNLASYI